MYKTSNKKYYVLIICLIIFSLIFVLLNSVMEEKTNDILIDDNNYLTEYELEEKESLYRNIKKTLKKHGYIDEYEKLNVYKKLSINGSDFIYVQLDDNMKTIYECYKKENKYSCIFLGNNISKHNKSKYSNITYLELTNPSEYKKEEKLKKMREEAKTATADGDKDWK